ncbi:MAG: two-component system response regulator [Phototrophicales bacterium]|nr:MAG: two-component system response regulator [Phototrophicales bacterium]
MSEKQKLIRIVCVEDEAEMIELVKMILSRKRSDGVTLEVHGANGGREGIELIKEIQPDLILLDLMMPDVDGWEVYQEIKNNTETSDIPVIILTAKAQSIDKLLGLHIARVNDYVTKPFGPQELIDSVERVLRENGLL